MAELFPQDTSTSSPVSASADFPGLIRLEGARRGPVQPTLPGEPAADWAKSPLYRAPEVSGR